MQWSRDKSLWSGELSHNWVMVEVTPGKKLLKQYWESESGKETGRGSKGSSYSSCKYTRGTSYAQDILESLGQKEQWYLEHLLSKREIVLVFMILWF